jgi:hypothetical protein
MIYTPTDAGSARKVGTLSGIQPEACQDVSLSPQPVPAPKGVGRDSNGE